MPWRTDTADHSIPADPPVPVSTKLGTGEAEIMSWDEICQIDEYQGRWVALDAARYDTASGRATAGQVVDVDDDLNDLCQRVREADRRSCAIVFCERRPRRSVTN